MNNTPSYLSELFLDSLNMDFSSEKLMSALQICNAEFLRRSDCLSPSPKTLEELRDFLDVYIEFDAKISRDKKTCLLLRSIKEHDLCIDLISIQRRINT